MNPVELKATLQQLSADHIKFAFADIDGVLRGKVISVKKLMDSLEKGIGFCDVVFGWDCNDQAYDNASLTGWHTGYPDKPLHVDLNTLRTIPWQNQLPFFLADYSASQLPACSRTLLKNIQSTCTAMGYRAEFAQEFEWFNFKENPQSLQQKQFNQLEPLTPGMFGYSILRTSLESEFYFDLLKNLNQFNIPIEGLHTETGPGVYEAAIAHDEVLQAADKACLFKTAVKEIAYKHGIVASFMAKWNEQLPGCSGHLHQSLWSVDGEQNLFYSSKDPLQMSDLMKHYLAGQLHCLPYLLPMYAPTINSYKRLVEGAWAPTTLTWGIENRTTALRIIQSSPKSTRIELRVPGADSNPYLAMAASLASGLYGIRHRLALEQPPTVGNGYQEKSFGVLPASLLEATRKMQESELAKELLGADFVEHFTQSRIWEHRQFAKQVTDWELKRYFEII